LTRPVLTIDDIARITIFASLDEEELRRICRAAADITLVAGEDAAPQGSERALFGLLEGRIDVFQATDGIERQVGVRHPGEIFGEVPITLGTVFPVSFRAGEPSRVLRLDPSDYHSISSASPEIAIEVGRLAQHRIAGAAGLSGLASAPPEPRAILVGNRWDASCVGLRHFLDRNQIVFSSILPDTPDAEERWGGPLPAEADWPAIRVIGGKTVVRPALRRVAELLDLSTESKDGDYDTVIVGGGPAGMAAAVYGASEGLKTIVVEREAPGGQAGMSSKIANYLGFPDGVTGDELAARALRQARNLGAEILVTRTTTRIDAATRDVHLDGGDVLRARTIILACGVAWRQLSIEGFDRLAGKGVFYGAAQNEAKNVHGLDVHIVGAGNSAGQAAINFANHARSVTLLCRSGGLEKSMSQYLITQLGQRANIDVLVDTEVAAAHGEASIDAIDVRNSETGETTRVDTGGLYIFIGADAETAWLPEEIALDPRGYVLTGTDVSAADRWSLEERDPYLLETSVPGVFAVGDVRYSPVKRVAAAVGEGSMAIAFVHQYFKDMAVSTAPA
jgi:thioredoxin reductase (NADPH)